MLKYIIFCYKVSYAYPQVTTYPDKITMAFIRTNNQITRENSIKETVGFARGPKEFALTPATLPRRDLQIE